MERIIRLADGRSWGVRACGETRQWTDEFGRIMGMEKHDGITDASLSLLRVDPCPGKGAPPWWSPPAGYPGEGWRVRISPGLELWSHPEVEETIGGLGDYHDRESTLYQMRFALYPLYEETVLSGGLPVHAALLEHEGRGILLAGRSGVGKSTACSRVPVPWKPLGDDLVLVVRDAEGRYHAHALPTWSALRSGQQDRTWDVGRPVPVAGIFFLVQSGTDETVYPGGGAASVMLDSASMMVFRSVNSVTDPIDGSPLRRNVYSNAASMVSSVPCYVLRLSLTGPFWETIEEALEKADRGLIRGRRELTAHGR